MKTPRIGRVLLTAAGIVLVTAGPSQAAPVAHGFAVTAPDGNGGTITLDIIGFFTA